MPQSVALYIRRRARRYGIDPNAAIAVALGEGGLVNRPDDIGDKAGGGSYGPFQLYAKGALPARYRGNPRAADAWAWSNAGIDYALAEMAGAGARGLSGEEAVRAIISRFERPRDPEGSIAAALSRLGSGPDTDGSPEGAPTPSPASSAAPDRRAFVQALLDRSRNRSDPRMLMELIRMAPANQPAVGGASTVHAPPAQQDRQRAAGGGLFDLLAQFGLTDDIASGFRPGARTHRGTLSWHARKDKQGNPLAADLNHRSKDAPRLVAYARENPGEFEEFYGPFDWHIDGGRLKRGRYPGHDDHIHAVRR